MSEQASQPGNQPNFQPDSDVLIVGAGPTGLTLANDLLSRGIKFKIVDKAAAATSISKAIVVHARTMEHLANLGFTDTFIEHGLPLRGSNIYAGNKRIVQIDFDEIDSPYKFILSIPQSTTERILADNLSCAEIMVDRNCELLGFTQSAEGVVARLKRTTPGGAGEATLIEEFEHRCLYLVGCDGAHSTVRHATDISFDGAPYADVFGAADVRIECDLKPNEIHGFFSEDGALLLIPFGDERFRVIFEADGGGKINTGDTLEFSTVLDVVKKRVDKSFPLKISDPHWLAWFKIHRRCASTYRQGRILLVGDAGHVHSPVGGVGMNTGMQDAFNLGWKLGLACRGLATESLLDSYTEERHAVGMAVLKGTDLATKVVTLKSPLAKAARNGLMTFMASHEVVQQRIIKSGTQTGVNYRQMSLSQESARPQVESIGRSLFPLPFKKGVTGEMPGLGSWLDFADAPVAGDFAPDAELDDGGFRLSHHIGSPRFKLLLFDGYEATDDGYLQMYNLEYKVASRFCDWIDIYVVVPFAEGHRQLPNYASVIYDDQKYLHEYYGASSECLYLIRPDGYIGFRSQPASYDKLEEYLARIFKQSVIQIPGKHS